MKKRINKKIKKLNFILSLSVSLLMLLYLFFMYEKNNGSLLDINSIFNSNNNFSLTNNSDTILDYSSANNSSSSLQSNNPNINSTTNFSVNKTQTIISGGGGGSVSAPSSPPAPDIPPLPNNSTPINSTQNNSNSQGNSSYKIHQDITVTFFWVGEPASEENEFISNTQSAWDDRWKEHYGGTDSPNNRVGYFPAGFTPKENPFYFALPYNDFDEDANRKQNSQQIPWYKEKSWGELESMCKNRWIRITKGNKTCYAQWEDVGPFEEDDFSYVFGNSLPKSKINNNAGLDVSPAVHDYLGLQDIDKVSWQFVNFSDVPSGPWKTIITSSQIFWE